MTPSDSPSEHEVVLEARQLTKHYGGVVANEGVDVAFRSHEIVAIIGDNGAGKSTLVKMLSGALPPDSGEIIYKGESVKFDGPLDARQRGIEIVYQDLALAPFLDVVGNLFLGREITFGPRTLGVMDRRAMAREASRQLQELEITLPRLTRLPVARLSGGQQQAVAVARAAAWARTVLFMDEPTAALGVRQSRAVLELARRLAKRGTAVVLITHTLPFVMEFADRIIVLRHGRKVADMATSDATPEHLVSLIVGFAPGLAADPDSSLVR